MNSISLWQAMKNILEGANFNDLFHY